MTVPSTPITTGITVTFMLRSFFITRSRYLFLFLLSFSFTLWSAGTAKSTIFLLTITRFGRLAEIRWSVCISKSQRSYWVPFSRTDSGGGGIIIIIIIIESFSRQFKWGQISRTLSILANLKNDVVWTVSTCLIIIIIIIIIITPLEFFTSASADGFLLEFEWQQVSSSLPDSSQYSGRLQ